jgi:putative membrane protein
MQLSPAGPTLKLTDVIYDARATPRPGDERMKKLTHVVCCFALASLAAAFAPSLKAQATDQDKQFLTNASQSNFDEIQLGKLAEQKASNPDVKAFGRRMVTDHTKLTENMKPFATSWGINPPTALSSDAQKEYDKLQGMSGQDFDKEYISDMVSDHSKDLDAFTKEVKDTKDAKFKAAVEQGKSVVAAHKNMAYSLKKKL